MKKILTLALTLLASTPSWGAGELIQNIITTAPSAVSITTQSSTTTAAANPETGQLGTAISAKFLIKTNGNDSNYNFILTSKVNTQSGFQNAYSPSGGGYSLIFGNISSLPTLASINNIKNAPSTPTGNPNAIAYSQTVTKTNFQSITAQNIPTYGGICYKLIIGSASDGNVLETVNTTPIANTYSINEDSAGTYQVIMTMSAYRL